MSKIAENIITDTQIIDTLRQLCGYVEDGSHESLSIGQDDATKIWYVSVGDWTAPRRKVFYGDSLRGALGKAAHAVLKELDASPHVA